MSDSFKMLALLVGAIVVMNVGLMISVAYENQAKECDCRGELDAYFTEFMDIERGEGYE